MVEKVNGTAHRERCASRLETLAFDQHVRRTAATRPTVSADASAPVAFGDRRQRKPKTTRDRDRSLG